MNELAVIIITATAVILLLTSIGLVVWLHVRFSHMPQGTTNVRAITGAIDAVRVQMDSNAVNSDDHFVKIRAKLSDVIEMIDVYVLRVNSGVGNRKGNS